MVHFARAAINPKIPIINQSVNRLALFYSRLISLVCIVYAEKKNSQQQQSVATMMETVEKLKFVFG